MNSSQVLRLTTHTRRVDAACMTQDGVSVRHPAQPMSLLVAIVVDMNTKEEDNGVHYMLCRKEAPHMSTNGTETAIIELPAQFLRELIKESFYYIDKKFPLASLKWEGNLLVFAATDNYKVLRFATHTLTEAPEQGMLFTLSDTALREAYKVLEKAKDTCKIVVSCGALFMDHDENSIQLSLAEHSMGINPQATITVAKMQMSENIGHAVSSVYLNVITNKARDKNAVIYNKGSVAHIEFLLRGHAIRKAAKNTSLEDTGYELDGFIKLKNSNLNEGSL